jgi:membrane peptidoglycan carboxypeptidase
VVDAVQREFVANPAFGATEAERRELFFAGGVQIKVTLDPRLQNAAAAAARRAPDGMATAMVAVDPDSGAIRVLHNSGQPGPRQSDVATQGRRQPGSGFKPLVAAAALEAGMPPYQVLAGDGPVEIDGADGPRAWHVDNFNGADYGLIDLRGALVSSVNTAFAQLATALGQARIVNVAERLGVDVEGAFGPPAQRGPAVGIGGLAHGVSPLEMASAYATFATAGRRAPPYLIATVTAADGTELYRAQPQPKSVLDPAVAGTVVDMLEDVVAQGTGTRAQLPSWSAMGKTGTSDGSADAWFIGAVPKLSAAVWVGHAEGGEPVGTMTGGSVAAPMWRQFMTAALQGTPPTPFPSTPSLSSGRPITLPSVRGCPWISDCDSDTDT